MIYTKYFSVFLMLLISVFIIDFKYTEEVERKEKFNEFECGKSSTSIRLSGGSVSNCYLICESGDKIYLPKNVTFEESFHRGDELVVLKTGFFGFAKKIVFRNVDEMETVEVSDLYNTFIFYSLLVSIFVYLLYLKFFRTQFFQFLFGLFSVLNLVILFFYIYLH